MFERKTEPIPERYFNLTEKEKIYWLDCEREEECKQRDVVSSLMFTSSLKKITDNGECMFFEYLPRCDNAEISDEIQLVLKNIHYLYFMIQEYAYKNNINPLLRRYKKFYRVKINGVGYEIGSTIEYNRINEQRLFCNQIPVDEGQYFIDFNDVINNKRNYSVSKNDGKVDSQIKYDEVEFFIQDKIYYYTFKGKTYPISSLVLRNFLTLPFKAKFISIPRKKRKEIIESLINTYYNIDFVIRHQKFIEINADVKKIVDPIDNVKKYELVCNLPIRKTILVYPLTKDDLLNLESYGCDVYEYCAKDFGPIRMSEVPLNYAKTNFGDYYLLVSDLLLTDNEVLASKCIELQCDMICHNFEKKLLNLDKQSKKRKTLKR